MRAVCETSMTKWLPLFDRIERSTGLERDDAITRLVERLRAIDMSVFAPR